MKKINKILLALSFFGSAFFLNQTTFAQTYEIGGFTGLALYKGEISNYPNPVNFGGNFQAIGRYNIDNYSTIRVNLAESIISANDKNSNTNLANSRNTNFSSTIGELSFIYEHNFFPYRKEKERIPTTPYVFGGLGVSGFNSTGGTEQAKGNVTPVIPFGIGTKTTLTKNWNLNFEFGTRKTFTDLLDNTHDEVNTVQTGLKNTYDWYSFLSIGITYTIYPLKCPQ